MGELTCDSGWGLQIWPTVFHILVVEVMGRDPLPERGEREPIFKLIVLLSKDSIFKPVRADQVLLMLHDFDVLFCPPFPLIRTLMFTISSLDFYDNFPI